MWLVDQLLKDGYVKTVKSQDSVEADTGQVLLPSAGAEDKGMVRHQGAMVDLESRTAQGTTPLMMAATVRNAELIRVLLKYGAKTEAVDSKGWSAVMIGAHNGHVEGVEAMLQHGAEVDFGNPSDKLQTALMVAAAAGKLEAVLVLVQHGADLDQIDAHGDTALNYAFSNRQQTVVEWMQNKGATMRMGHKTSTTGFDLELTSDQLGSYLPIQDPEVDIRNPRYVGPQ